MLNNAEHLEKGEDLQVREDIDLRKEIRDALVPVYPPKSVPRVVLMPRKSFLRDGTRN